MVTRKCTDGVFYFADDDNTYESIYLSRCAIQKRFPCGRSPIVKAGKLAGFYEAGLAAVNIRLNMAGFAVSQKCLLRRLRKRWFPKKFSPFNNTEIELLANNCTEILTWHTQTKKNNPAEAINATKHAGTNLILLEQMLVRH
ncbi:hypothetical protein DOY81_010200 [Sarcophaga bullata]|nr:hypothetical protein DOY81_010200 [Sarcophaga bullata]